MGEDMDSSIKLLGLSEGPVSFPIADGLEPLAQDVEEGSVSLLREPLVGDDEHQCEANDSSAAEHHKGHSSVAGETCNIANAIIGAGVVAFPYKALRLGIVLGVVLNAAIAALMVFSSSAVIRAADRCCKRTYTELMRAELGRVWQIVLQWCILLGNTGILVVFLIVIGDILVGSEELHGLIPSLEGDNHKGSWYNSRWFVTLMVIIVFLVPLVSLRNISSLEVASTTGVAIAILFSVLGVTLAALAAAAGTISGINWWIPQKTRTLDIVRDVLKTSATYVFAYFVNQELPPLMEGLKVYTRASMIMATNWAMALSFFIYVLVQVPMYLAFQSETQGDILLNLTPEGLTPLLGSTAAHTVGMAVLLCYALKIIAIFPLINWPVRENVSDLIFRTPRPVGWRFYFSSYLILLIIYLIAVFVQQVVSAIDFVGSTAGVMIALLSPAALLYRERRGCNFEMVIYVIAGVLILFSAFTK